MKKILLFMFLMMIFILDVNAEACDAYDIKRLKEIADGVEITYETVEPYEIDGMMIYDDYKIRITGLTDEIYVYDYLNKKKISSISEMEYTSFKSGKVNFAIFSNICSGRLKEISIILPIYNRHRFRSECKEINYKISYCNKYLDNEVTDEEFYISYNKYINDNKIDELNVNNIMIICIIFVSVLLVFLVLFILKKRRGRLE